MDCVQSVGVLLWRYRIEGIFRGVKFSRMQLQLYCGNYSLVNFLWTTAPSYWRHIRSCVWSRAITFAGLFPRKEVNREKYALYGISIV